MRLSDALKNKLYDIRLRDKLIAEGKLTQEQVKEYYDSLEDCSEKMIYTSDVEEGEDKPEEKQEA